MPFSHPPFPSPGAQSSTQGSVATNKANIADQLSHPDYDDIEWTEATSKNGVPFLVGVRRTEVKGAPFFCPPSLRDHRDDFKRPRALDTYECGVNWPVGNESWKQTSAGPLHTNFISKYSLYESSVPFFDYRLDIYHVSDHKVKYTFHDQTGDHYTLHVYLVGKHYVLYNSDRPTIVEVVVEV
ncbi:hypothetical protein BC827DRAFT_1155879 [Russula dissimulans]|nr:hypothetical protein BC827DRAFT_1155879 [Russula dissimulans]